jgi:hypothetical protein
MSFTDADKEWLTTQLVTAGAGLELRVGARLEQIEQRIGRLEQVERRFDAKLEHLETKRRTEFREGPSPADLRKRTHTLVLRALDLEMEALSDRLNKLEPPH